MRDRDCTLPIHKQLPLRMYLECCKASRGGELPVSFTNLLQQDLNTGIIRLVGPCLLQLCMSTFGGRGVLTPTRGKQEVSKSVWRRAVCDTDP